MANRFMAVSASAVLALSLAAVEAPGQCPRMAEYQAYLYSRQKADEAMARLMAAQQEQQALGKEVGRLRKDAEAARQSVAAAQKPVEEIRKTLGEAQAKLAKVKQRLTEEYEKTPPVVEAGGEVETARLRVNALRGHLLKPLAANAAYVKAQAAYAAARKELDALRQKGGEGLPEAALEVLETERKVASLENAVLEASAEYQAALAALASANDKLARLRAQFAATLQQVPEIVAAVAAQAEAQTRLKEAAATHQAALRAQAQADTQSRAASTKYDAAARTILAMTNEANRLKTRADQARAGLVTYR